MNKLTILFFTSTVILFSCGKHGGNTLDDTNYAFIDSLTSVMTLDEKIGQMTLYTSGWDVTGPTLNDQYRDELKEGRVGALFNAHTVAYNKELQRIAVEETNLGIPLLFGYDVIHGHKTIFPIPLAESCTWDLDLIRETARLSAREAAASGLNWTFNPMVDIARDPRWGRIAEGSGEDPYLGGLIGTARVKGYQGDDLKDPFTMLACVKHFAAYGAAQAGRDYHTVDISDRTLREIYLPPFRSTVDAGVATVMTSFNELDGIPATGSEYLLTDILRGEWGFDGFVVTDYTSINEMVPHGVAADDKEAALLAFKAGVDMDMQGGLYNQHLSALVKSGEVQESAIDRSVKKILAMKQRLGLFDDPYLYLDEQREKEVVFSSELMQHALEVARQSIVLLKNENFNGQHVLPMSQNIKNIAVIGPLGDNKKDLLGTWHASGDASKVVTLTEGIAKLAPQAKITYTKGAGFYGDDQSGFSEARQAAANADFVVLALGENYIQSGEAASRASIDLPANQNDLVHEIMKLNKPTVAVVMAGRPLVLTSLDRQVPAILSAWHLGTKAGQAIAEVLFGSYNPSGKLTVTFPRSVGQVPIHYSMKNTGRPFNADNKYTSKYIDESNEPLFPFGYGLSYTTFSYGGIQLSKREISSGDNLNIKIMVKNSGTTRGTEIVQLYTRDLVGSVTRPVKELKGFKKIALDPSESAMVEFNLSSKDLAFYRKDMTYGAEPGQFEVYIGGNSAEVKTASFTLVE